MLPFILQEEKEVSLMPMIALDMDGTLLNSKKEISPDNLAAILEAQARGYEIVIATGRFSKDAWRILRPYGFSHWLISSNGAMIHSPAGEVLRTTPMDPADLRQAITWLDANGYYFEVTSDQGIHAWLPHHASLLGELEPLKAADPQTDIERLRDVITTWSVQKGYLPIDSFDALLALPEEWHNILVISFTPQLLVEGMKHFESWGRLTLSSSWRYNFELMAPATSKGNALKMLGDRLGIPMTDTMAIGDNHNDLSMLTLAAYGVAMGNAEEAVLSRCPIVTRSHENHGVARAIEALLNCPDLQDRIRRGEVVAL